MNIIIIIMIASAICFALFAPFITSNIEGNRLDRLANICFSESNNYEENRLCYCSLIKYSQEHTHIQLKDNIGIC